MNEAPIGKRALGTEPAMALEYGFAIQAAPSPAMRQEYATLRRNSSSMEHIRQLRRVAATIYS
ncbi:MAG: hypothetical protein IJT30_06040 [Muribaculaceae bacterium]|nr:hypothetical protein [Muribaculaceae bacterium]